MKKTKIIGSILIALALSGCNGFLNQKPQSFISSSTFYQTPSQINEALNGVYNGLGILYGTRNGSIANSSSFWAMTEERSDNTTFQYNAGNRGALMREEMDYFLVTPDNTYSLGVWSQLYQTIGNANLLLSKIANVKYPPSDTNGKKYAEGQAEFIRALCYFNLVRLWANVPLVLDPTTTPDQTKGIKQSTPAAVYAQIIKDATDAASKLPATWTGNDLGRATQGAANTLLGEVYMTMGQPGNKANYQKADSYFQKVISSGDYSLLANYADLWDTKHKNSLESVFEIQYSGATNNAYSNYIYTFAPINSASVVIGHPGGTNSGRNMPTRDMEKAYEPGDSIRYSASIAWFVDPSNTQWAEAQHDSVPYVNKYATKYSVPNKQDNDFYVYRYAQVLLWDAEAKNEVNGPTAEAYNYVNMVRNRAGLSDLAAGMTQAQFETAVWHEERVEGAFEDHRWFQLLRTGRAIAVMTANGAEQKAYQSSWLGAGSYDIKPYKLLYPIPQRDVVLQNYTQNPGWSN